MQSYFTVSCNIFTVSCNIFKPHFGDMRFNLTRKQLVLRLRKVPNEDDVKFVISFP